MNLKKRVGCRQGSVLMYRVYYKGGKGLWGGLVKIKMTSEFRCLCRVFARGIYKKCCFDFVQVIGIVSHRPPETSVGENDKKHTF